MPNILGDIIAPDNKTNEAFHDVGKLLNPLGMALAFGVALSGRPELMSGAANVGNMLTDLRELVEKNAGSPTGLLDQDAVLFFQELQETIQKLQEADQSREEEQKRSADGKRNGEDRAGEGRLTDDPREIRPEKPGGPDSPTMVA